MNQINNVVNNICKQIANKYDLIELDTVICVNMMNEKEYHIYYRSTEVSNMTAIANIDVEAIDNCDLKLSVMLHIANCVSCTHRELIFTNMSDEKEQKYILTDVYNVI